MIQELELVASGTGSEIAKLFELTHRNGYPPYFRLSDYTNKTEVDVHFGKSDVI